MWTSIHATTVVFVNPSTCTMYITHT